MYRDIIVDIFSSKVMIGVIIALLSILVRELYLKRYKKINYIKLLVKELSYNIDCLKKIKDKSSNILKDIKRTDFLIFDDISYNIRNTFYKKYTDIYSMYDLLPDWELNELDEIKDNKEIKYIDRMNDSILAEYNKLLSKHLDDLTNETAETNLNMFVKKVEGTFIIFNARTDKYIEILNKLIISLNKEPLSDNYVFRFIETKLGIFNFRTRRYEKWKRKVEGVKAFKF